MSSEYVGGGPLARLISDLDEEERKERNQNRSRWKRNKQEVKSIEVDLAQLNEMTMSLVRAALLTSGYHPHKRQWRRKRNG